MNPSLILSNNNELFRFYPEDIVFISADHNYSHITTASGDERLIVQQLGQIEPQIAQQLGAEATQFIRIGRGLIINRNYIYYINVQKDQLILKSPNGKLHSLAVHHEPLAQLKKVIENDIAKPIKP